MKTEVISIPSLKCDITFIVGQCDTENDEIVRNANPSDLWFHVDNKKSCHVIANVPIQFDRKNIKYIVSQGAVLCKKYSYPKEKNLPIVFTRVKNVELTDTPGLVFIPEDCKSIKTC
jgi:predicted ribosome quality control (RQC) complex YloA/Tae2 family protein